MKKVSEFFVLIVLLVFAFQVLPVAAAGSSFSDGLKNTSLEAGYPVAKAESNPGAFFVQMLGGVLAPVFIGVIAMVILIYGGYTWMTARGEEQKVEKAKALITNTIIAIIVIFSAYAIVKLIIPLWQFVTT